MKIRDRVMMVSVILATLLIIGSFGLVGCAKAPTEAPPGGYKSITIVDGSMGSSTQAMLISMARVLGKYYPEISWGVRTGVGALSSGLLTEGTVPMAMSGPTHYIAQYGEGMEAKSRLKSIAMLNQSISFMIAVKDAPFDNGRDLPKGYGLCGGVPGTSDIPGTELFLKALGLKKTDFAYRELSKTEGAEAWRNGLIQAWMMTGGLPPPVLTELSASKQGYKVLKVSEADLKPVQKEAQAKGFFVKELPLVEGAPWVFSYNTWGLETPFFLAVRDDFPAEITYKMAKIFDEHLDELVAGTILCKVVTPAVLLKSSSGGAYPIHPGVEKYFKEKGYLK